METSIFLKIYKKFRKAVKTNYIIDYLFCAPETRSEKQLLFVIGDSHVSVFSGHKKMQPEWPDRGENLIPYFKIYRIGAPTAFNSYKYIKTILKILNNKSSNFNKASDILVLSFGEIDIRAHVFKQVRNNNNSVEKVVGTIVENYIKTIKTLMTLNYRIAIWAPIGSTPYDSLDKDIPVYGSCLERNIATKLFIQKIKNWADENHIIIISVFDEMIDSKGYTKKEVLADKIHLSIDFLPKIIERFHERGLLGEYFS